MVFVDAQTDKLLNRYSMIHDGLEREIYEQAYTEANKVYDEGDGDRPGDPQRGPAQHPRRLRRGVLVLPERVRS